MTMSADAVTPENAPRDPAQLAGLKRFQQAMLVEALDFEIRKMDPEADVWAKLVATQEVPNRNTGALKSAFVSTSNELRGEILSEGLALYDRLKGGGAPAPAATKKRAAPPPALAAPPADVPANGAPAPETAAAPLEGAKNGRKASAKAPAPPTTESGSAGLGQGILDALATLTSHVEGLTKEVRTLQQEFRDARGSLQVDVNQALTIQEQVHQLTQVAVGLVSFVVENGVKVDLEHVVPELDELNTKLEALLTPAAAEEAAEGKAG